ncbi:MAG TPA: hypothetical protein VFW96_26080, partial [Thermomicrobiales bacterium]|nr:hypothetical protein [Thermomicrobiales bacterium]
EPYEVYMLRRPETARFAPGVHIFPGGTLDADDRAIARALLASPAAATIAALHARMAGDGPFASPDAETTGALAVCAVRELFEEAGVLLARDTAGRPLACADAAGRRRRREDLLESRLTFADLLAGAGATPDLDALVYFSHWVTPEASRLRYDTHFFLALLPAGQRASHYPGEMTGGLWLTPREGLARRARGETPMIGVQARHLERLAEYPTPDALFAFARHKPVPVVLPVLGEGGREAPLPEELRRCW